MIYINGDSWSRNLWIEWSPSDWSWPKQLQEFTKIPVLNESVGCGSNSRILSRLHTNYILGNQFDLVLIALSTHARWHLPGKNMSAWSIGPTVQHDRLFKSDPEILPWWQKNSYDYLEYVFQYYSTVWQIHELCKNLYQCPVVVFNTWDKEIQEIDQMMHGQASEFESWMQRNFVSEDGFAIENYIKAFEFFKQSSTNWQFESTTMQSLLTQEHYDGAQDRDPEHPNKQGHTIICQHVLDTVAQRLPNTYSLLLEKYNGQ